METEGEALISMLTETEPITLRAATDDDDAFLRRVYATTRAAEMAMVDWNEQQKEDFLRMQFNAQHTFYHENFGDAAYDVILRGEEPIGRLYVDRREDDVRILDIALLPEFCGGGVGTKLIEALQSEAARSGVTVSLHVETFNRARSLYDRLGFVERQVDGIYILMDWTPSAA